MDLLIFSRYIRVFFISYFFQVTSAAICILPYFHVPLKRVKVVRRYRSNSHASACQHFKQSHTFDFNFKNGKFCYFHLQLQKYFYDFKRGIQLRINFESYGWSIYIYFIYSHCCLSIWSKMAPAQNLRSFTQVSLFRLDELFSPLVSFQK